MNIKNPEEIQIKLEKKVQKRLKKKHPKMKVSGTGVKKLQRLIISKSKRGCVQKMRYIGNTPRFRVYGRI
jgi:hypothetical protein